MAEDLQRRWAADTWRILKSTVGHRIDRVDLIVYMVHGQPKDQNTPLQLWFDDGSVLLLEGASDGESLRASTIPWDDPFASKMDEVNREFVRTHGKWELHNASHEAPFASIVGARVQAVHPILDRFGVLSGVQFEVANHHLNFYVDCDECYVVWGRDNALMAKRQMTIGTGTPADGATPGQGQHNG